MKKQTKLTPSIIDLLNDQKESLKKDYVGLPELYFFDTPTHFVYIQTRGLLPACIRQIVKHTLIIRINGLNGGYVIPFWTIDLANLFVESFITIKIKANMKTKFMICCMEFSNYKNFKFI